MNDCSNITEALSAWRAGASSAQQQLDKQIYATLKQMARARARDSGPSTLSPTALVNEAVLRMLDADTDFESRSHFFALAALQMRSVLVDHARRRGADKRGGDQLQVTFDADLAAVDADEQLLELHEALEKLAREDARTARVLELTYFGGMNASQLSSALSVSVATIERDLKFGRSWLRTELGA
jgi:RNA polymerase sigma factor (TIGR02999 family)